MSCQKIKLVTRDDSVTEIERRAAERSVLIKNLLADLEFGPDEVVPAIPIPNVSLGVLRKVVEWCEHHQDDEDPATEPSSEVIFHSKYVECSDWDRQFMEVDLDMLLSIILASNYLDIKPLLVLGYNAVANKIRGRSLEDIDAILNNRSSALPCSEAPGSSVDSQKSENLPYTSTFHPTPQTAFGVRELLAHRLPPELAIPIVTLGYSPWLVKRRVEEQSYRADDFSSPSDPSVAGLYLSTEPIPLGIGKVIPQRVIFQTRAADQGWATFGGDGTFHNSHTWFEASILQPSSDRVEDEVRAAALEHDGDLSEPWEDAGSATQALRDKGWEFVRGQDGQITWRVCNSITARSKYKNYRVEWRRGLDTEVEDERATGKGEGFLELLQPGFAIVLWARAEQRAWINRVAAASIEIEYELL
ncbi:hypothetical protein CDD83_4933 [Cordyceps sp. RAO-2017]|nr:hypothetical protein CDD83_4933 [Cordyceps sp. RAO-2017]